MTTTKNLGNIWMQLQNEVQSSVVQVIAQIAQFDWLEPYEVVDQGENLATGFFIDKEGHIITNAHVVLEAQKVWVLLSVTGRRPIFADIVSICPTRDLALLKIQEQELSFLREIIGEIRPISWGDSDGVQRTDNVLVLGYALGQPNMKSSTGIISGHENIGGRSLIQITAPVNPGNSGAPLFNVQGEVIGIALSMIVSAQNVGYAIPINELKLVIDELYEGKPIVRTAFLGVRFNRSTDLLAQVLNNPVPAGMYINTVFKGTLLDRAGVCEGDMLYEFGGYKLDQFGDTTVPWSSEKISLADLVARLKTGDKIQIVLYRQGQKIVIETTFELTEPFPIRERYPGYEEIDYEVIGGLVVMELSDNHIPLLVAYAPSLINYALVENKLKPILIITAIIQGSLVQELGVLAPGATITHVNGVAVTTVETFRSAFRLSFVSQVVIIKNSMNSVAVLPLAQLLHDEERLSKIYGYPLSTLNNLP